MNERQQRRIQSIRTRRAAHWEERQQEEVALLMQNELGAQQEGLVIAHFGLNVEVDDGAGGRSRCAVRETMTDNPVCGDRVLWQSAGEGQGVIVAVLERRTVLRRPAAYSRLQTVAANVGLMVITTTAGLPNPELLDRYLVAAEASGIGAVIAVNKMDQPYEAAELEPILAAYVAMDYPVLRLSASRGDGLTSLDAAIAGQLVVFVGQSGVGKSSLIARYLPEDTVKIGAINLDTGLGRHTTTVARLYPLPGGGGLIDSPGVRDFALHGVAASEVAGYFRDFTPWLGRCRFSNCAHSHEPGCALHGAVTQGQIHPRRLENYHRIVAFLKGEESY